MAQDWSWFALQVTQGREFQAQAYLLDDLTLSMQELEREDVHVILPVRHSIARPRSRKAAFRARAGKLVARARIPGYLLMGFQPHASPVWGVIREVPHVIGVLGTGGEPKPVADRQLLVALLTDLEAWSRRRRRHKLRPVEIVNGPYQGISVGVIEVAGGDPEVYGVAP